MPTRPVNAARDAGTARRGWRRPSRRVRWLIALEALVQKCLRANPPPPRLGAAGWSCGWTWGWTPRSAGGSAAASDRAAHRNRWGRKDQPLDEERRLHRPN